MKLKMRNVPRMTSDLGYIGITGLDLSFGDYPAVESKQIIVIEANSIISIAGCM